MVTVCRRLFVSAILLAALPITGWAQDAKSVVATVAHTTGSENLRTLQYSASGSMYDEKGQHSPVKSYSRTMDFNATKSSVRYVQALGNPPSEHAANQTVDSTSPWNTQYDFWISPYGFLKGAAANAATLETKSVFGESYRVISFTLPGNHKVSGFVNAKDLIDRVQLSIENGLAVEGIYREYADFGGLKVPTLMIQNRGGATSQILIVQDAKPNG